MKPQCLSHSTMLLSLGVVTACGAYTQSAPRSSDLLEIAPRSASAKALGRPDFAPFEGRSLAEALGHLRPDWLRQNPSPSSRVNGDGERAMVYVNDVASGDLARLQVIAADAVTEVRLLSASEAWARYGPSCRCAAGAIVVRTRSSQ